MNERPINLACRPQSGQMCWASWGFIFQDFLHSKHAWATRYSGPRDGRSAGASRPPLILVERQRAFLLSFSVRLPMKQVCILRRCAATGPPGRLARAALVLTFPHEVVEFDPQLAGHVDVSSSRVLSEERFGLERGIRRSISAPKRILRSLKGIQTFSCGNPPLC